MPKFQKKPVVIEAVQYDGTPECARRIGLEITVTETGIQTLEGFMRASPGDWIITGVKGERYPCKPDIFDATYGPVSPDPTPDLARVTAERDAALSRVAALEAALLAEVRALVARNDYTPGSEGYASRQIVIEELRAILSGGTAALEARVAAKVAKAVEAERAAIRKRVEAVRRMEPALDPDGEAIVGRRDWGRLVYRDDVIAAIDAKEP